MVSLAPVAFVAEPPPEGQDLKNWATRQFEALQRQLGKMEAEQAGIDEGQQEQINAIVADLAALEARLAAVEDRLGADTWNP